MAIIDVLGDDTPELLCVYRYVAVDTSLYSDGTVVELGYFTLKIFSYTDSGRQERLLGSFGENQIFITAAGPFRDEALKLRAAKVIRISGGRVL